MIVNMDDVAHYADVEASPAQPGSFRLRIPQGAPVDFARWRPDMGHFDEAMGVGVGSSHLSFLACSS